MNQNQLRHDTEPRSVDQQQAYSAVFTHRIPANDGGLPFDFIDRRNDDYDCACVYRGDHDLGTGSKLLEAWDNYLYSISPEEAPVDDGVLAAMWAAYDEWVDLPNRRQ